MIFNCAIDIDIDIAYNRVIFLLFFSYAPTICLTLVLGAGMGVLRAGKGLFICFSILRFSHSASSID